MAVDLKALKSHPGLNPVYFDEIEARHNAMHINRKLKEAARNAGIDPRKVKYVPVPKQPNKYVPHIGAKQRNRSNAKSVSPNINQE